MQPARTLQKTLQFINGKGYKAYKKAQGAFEFPEYILFIDHAQGDPFSTPSRIRVQIRRNQAGFPSDTYSGKSRAIALADFLTRRFYYHSKRCSRPNRGIGNSGIITIVRPGQEILPRSAVRIDPEVIEVRFFMGLPAAGRTILGRVAEDMFFRELPEIIRASLLFANLDAAVLYRHVEAAEDADFLRSRLPEMGLTAFVADGSILPRKSGIDPAPLSRDQAVPFTAPADLRCRVTLPNLGTVTGMGIPTGVTLIVGGGYHGKSTLLTAIELGVYNHLPDDGRELAVTLEEAVKIRACDGRSVQGTDISPFINNLPFQSNTTAFSTQNASGSTSQAAGIVEAIEVGATVLLLDEDTSATNFMIRDHRMQRLVAKQYEPITPFIDKVSHLYTEKGISTILVMGGSGDYFSVADHVIHMANYRPIHVTEKARRIAAEIITGRTEEGDGRFDPLILRIPEEKSCNAQNHAGRIKITPRGRQEIRFGEQIISCRDVEQIVEEAQTRSIGYAIHYAARYMNGKRPLSEILKQVRKDLDDNGLDILPPWITGDLSDFRIFEIAAAINRMRNLKVTHPPEPQTPTGPLK